MKAPLRIAALYLTALLVSPAAANEAPVKNVIYLIGDGMGLAHVSAAMSESGKALNLERATAIGLAKTASTNSKVTDSAASATALATGFKTKNGQIGTLPDGNPVKNLREYTHDSGRSTGVVATSSITHATPAAFLAHQPSRKLHEEIAEEIVSSGVDVAIGAGRKFFEERKDGRNLSDALRAKNYSVVYTVDEVMQTKEGKLIGLLPSDSDFLPSVTEGRGNMAVQSTTKSLELLSKNRNGFFLMVEGSQIDLAAHRNDGPYTVSETLDFDSVVGKAMDFADANPGTLVVVTADHETGGLSLQKGPKGKDDTLNLVFGTKGHTGIMVPVFAYGAGAEKFSGVYENTEIFHKILNLLQLDQAPAKTPDQVTR